MSLRKNIIGLVCAASILGGFIPQAFAVGISFPITNPGAETGDLSGWTTSATDESWSILSSGAHGGTQAFQTGNQSSSMYQYIDLIALGVLAERISTYSYFEFSAWVKKTDDSPGTEDQYYLGLAERGWGFGAIATTGTPLTTAPSDWQHITIGLGNYGADLRYLQIEVGGYDATEGAGKKGPAFDDMTITMYGDSDAPVVVSLSPADNVTNISATTRPTMTFDQAVYVGTGNVTIHRTDNSATVSTVDITSGNVSGFGTNTLAITPTVTLSRGTEYYLTVDNTAILDLWDNPYLGITTPGNWSFRTIAPSSNSATPTQTVQDYSITNLTAAVGDTGQATLTWDAGANVTFVEVSASIDGAAAQRISDILPATESWTWQMPNEYQGKEVTFTVASTDLATVLQNATSPVVLWAAASTSNEEEAGNTFEPGSFVRTETLDTVYYIDATGKRRPIPDAQTYFTWETSFDVVQTINEVDLAELPLGSALPPKPGSVLIKVQSVPKVFAIDGTAETPVLRWITSENLATELYGDNWADYVIDIPPTMWSHLIFGDNIQSENDSEASNALLRREDLNTM